MPWGDKLSVLTSIGWRVSSLRQVLVETIHGILDGRISQKEAWAIGRRVAAELRLLRLMERLQPMVEREKAEAKRARAQALKAPVAQGKEWVN